MLFHMRAHSHHFPRILRFLATPRLTFLAVGLAVALIFANASNWVVDEAPANESLALLFVVLVEGRLEFLLVTDIVLHDVLRHLVLGESLHQNVLLYEVGAEGVDAAGGGRRTAGRTAASRAWCSCCGRSSAGCWAPTRHRPEKAFLPPSHFSP